MRSMLICAAASSDFCFGCADTYRFAQSETRHSCWVFAVQGDLHIWVNFLNARRDQKSGRGWGWMGGFCPSESVFILFPFRWTLRASFRIYSRTSISALLQRGIWWGIMLFIRGRGLYNCCSFDLVFGLELEREAV